MTRTCLILSLSFFAACGVEDLEAILAMYDTYGSTGPGDTSTGMDDTDGTTGHAGNSAGGSGGSTGDGGMTGAADTTGVTGMSEGTDGGTIGAESSGGDVTEGPGPACGDGVMAGEEECDDANEVEADGCRSDCTREWLVFVTSEPFTAGDIKGLVGADYQCRHRATKMFLPNGERYKAWISTSEVQAVDRLYHARGPYKLVNGLQVAASWDALVSGPLDNPIEVSELSETVSAPVFTGTLPDGTRAPDSSHCDDWTNYDGDNFAWFGATVAVDGDWTHAYESICGGHAGLYCFEQP